MHLLRPSSLRLHCSIGVERATWVASRCPWPGRHSAPVPFPRALMPTPATLAQHRQRVCRARSVALQSTGAARVGSSRSRAVTPQTAPSHGPAQQTATQPQAGGGKEQRHHSHQHRGGPAGVARGRQIKGGGADTRGTEGGSWLHPTIGLSCSLAPAGPPMLSSPVLLCCRLFSRPV